MRRRAIADVLAEARQDLDRVAPADLAAEMATGALLVDTRPVEQRSSDGNMPDAVVIDRNVLEWRLDPSSPHRIADATDYDRRIIVVCNEGYSSSLAAAGLRQLGLARATDLDGGFQAWRAFADASRTARTAEHWEQIYRSRAPAEQSWFQAEPVQSVELITAATVPLDTPIIDVGGGPSALAAVLLAGGYRDLTVLDVSEPALGVASSRLGADAAKVRWIAHDVLCWRPPRRYGLWHDRAVFHFLSTPGERAAYSAVLHKALAPGGSVVVATFAGDGPQMCSGLPTARYDPPDLAAALGPDLEVVTSRREEHITPGGATQPFTWLLLRARSGGYRT